MILFAYQSAHGRRFGAHLGTQTGRKPADNVAQAAREHHIAAKPPPPQGPNAAKYAELR